MRSARRTARARGTAGNRGRGGEAARTRARRTPARCFASRDSTRRAGPVAHRLREIDPSAADISVRERKDRACREARSGVGQDRHHRGRDRRARRGMALDAARRDRHSGEHRRVDAHGARHVVGADRADGRVHRRRVHPVPAAGAHAGLGDVVRRALGTRLRDRRHPRRRAGHLLHRASHEARHAQAHRRR